MADSSAKLRFASDILQRLGEELIPNPEQGLIELVKNSYDAESLECTVSLSNVTKPGGTITIKDKGNGMQKNDLKNGFLIIGRSRKDPKTPTDTLHRLPVGDKGLGRLAALRLGHQVTVTSRPKSRPGVEFTLVIDWDKIEASKFIEKVKLSIAEGKTTEGPGVTIEIQNLRKALPDAAIKRLARELLLISDPFSSDTDFKAKLEAPEFLAWQKLVEKSYFEDATYYLTAGTDDSGSGIAELIEVASGTVLASTALPLDGVKYQMPSAQMQLWMYRLGTGFTSNSSTLTAVKDWVQQFGGVYIYHRNLRIRPYGDPGSDWLDMNLSRASHPEERPSTNNSIGRVTIEDPELKFVQPTSRMGFVDNNAFEDLRRFGQDAIRWSSDYRLKVVEEQRKLAKQNAAQLKQDAINELEKSLADLKAKKDISKGTATQVTKALRKVKEAQKQEVVALRDDLQLYRSLATAGTTSAVFAHEAAKPLSLLNTISDTIERRGRLHLAAKYDTTLKDPVKKLKDIYYYLNVYSQFPIYHLKKSKRRTGPINVVQVWESVIELFTPLLKQAKIDVKTDFDTESIIVRGSVALLEAVATNLISNSVHALTKAGSRMENRLISIKGQAFDKQVHIVHADNGPGISMAIDEIWLPGKTTNAQGTGFGLTIVKDSITDLRGDVEAISRGNLGGAEFHINFPIN